MKKILKIIFFPITFPIYLIKKIFTKKPKKIKFEKFVENIKTLKTLKTNFKAAYTSDSEKYEIDYKQEKKGA